MNISEAAAAAGVSARSLRHYEERGLLAPRRTSNGYRHYDERDLRRVENIRTLLDAGLTTDDAQALAGCLDGDLATAPPGRVGVELARRRLADLDARIARLQAVRGRLLVVLDEADEHTDSVDHGRRAVRADPQATACP